jgi:hypothetical protein
MRVTAELDCYLLPTIPVHREKSVMHTLQVTRSPDGFHVRILGNDTWPADANPNSVQDWIPVASIGHQ